MHSNLIPRILVLKNCLLNEKMRLKYIWLSQAFRSEKTFFHIIRTNTTDHHHRLGQIC